MYWDIYKTLSHNCLFNFIIGERGCGKTYGAKKHVIKEYLNKGNKFIYLRRYKTELKKNKHFFKDIISNNEYPNIKLSVNNSEYMIDDKVAGYAMPLSTAKIEKSVSFNDVDLIIFDEFIIEKGVYHYLDSEVKAFEEFYLTISRYRPVKVLFLANAITMTNPYFLHYNINLPYNSNFYKRDDMLLEMVNNPDFREHVSKTRVGKFLLKNSPDYADYAINNQFMLDNNNFVQKRPAAARFSFNFIHNSIYYGVWIDYRNGLLFVSNDYEPSSNLTYATTTADHKPNTMLLKRVNHSSFFKMFIDNFKLGNVRFESVKIKNICYEILKNSY